MKNALLVLLMASVVACAAADEGENEELDSKLEVAEELEAKKETEPQIVGGEPATLGQFPSAVYIKIGSSGLCGGSILSESWVMTAAHCIGSLNPATYKVVAGALDRDQDSKGTFQVVSAERVVKHERYNPQTSVNDIALIRVKPPFRFNEFVNRTALPSKTFVTPKTAVVAGWGTLSSGGRLPRRLQWVELDVVSRTACNAAYQKEGITITDSMICAARTGKDACQGDSGGALFSSTPAGTKVAVGVVSFGIGCAQNGFPGVYTETKSYIEWLQTHIGKRRRQTKI